MTENTDPYQTPGADIDALQQENPSTARLYKIGHVGIATFFGSAVAGFLLMALNYDAFGRPDESRNAILFGIAATVLLLVGAYFTPDYIPATPINIAIVFGVMKYAEHKQGTLLAEYLANGATLHSGWRAFGISLLCLLGVVAVIAAVVFFLLMVNPELLGD